MIDLLIVASVTQLATLNPASIGETGAQMDR